MSVTSPTSAWCEELVAPLVLFELPQLARTKAAAEAATDRRTTRRRFISGKFPTMGRKPMSESTTGLRPRPAHVTLAVVLQVREGLLQVLLWERAREPFAGCWALPGGYLEPDETLESSIRRHLAAKVDVRELSHLEQLETRSEPERVPG